MATFRAGEQAALRSLVLEPAKASVAVQIEKEERAKHRERVKREKREAREREARAAAERDRKPADLDTLGIEAPPDWLAGVARLQRRLYEIKGHAQRSAGIVHEAEERLPLPMRTQILAAASQLRAAALDAFPAAVCPYCKLAPALMPSCTHCLGFGYLTKAQLQDVPGALWRVDHPLVIGPDGRPMALRDALQLSA